MRVSESDARLASACCRGYPRLDRSRDARQTRRSELRRLEGLADLSEEWARVAEEHAGLLVIEKRVVDSREPVAHAALQHDDVARTIDIENRHSVDRARRIVARGWVHNVVRTHHQYH